MFLIVLWIAIRALRVIVLHQYQPKGDYHESYSHKRKP